MHGHSCLWTCLPEGRPTLHPSGQPQNPQGGHCPAEEDPSSPSEEREGGRVRRVLEKGGRTGGGDGEEKQGW